VTKLQLSHRTTGSVGDETRDPHAVRLRDPQLRPGKRSFLAHEQARAHEPAVEDNAGEFGDPGAVPYLPPVSTAGARAECGTFSMCWWMVPVIIMPTEYDSHRPRRASHATNSWVPPPESVRMRVCRSRRNSLGSWAKARHAAVMWSAAVFEAAFPGRSKKAAAGSPVPHDPWSPKPISG
jgi:hypothetical protein